MSTVHTCWCVYCIPTHAGVCTVYPHMSVCVLYTHTCWCGILSLFSPFLPSHPSHFCCLLLPPQIADIMHSLFKTHGAQLLPFFDELLPIFTAMVVSVVCARAYVCVCVCVCVCVVISPLLTSPCPYSRTLNLPLRDSGACASLMTSLSLPVM